MAQVTVTVPPRDLMQDDFSNADLSLLDPGAAIADETLFLTQTGDGPPKTNTAEEVSEYLGIDAISEQVSGLAADVAVVASDVADLEASQNAGVVGYITWAELEANTTQADGARGTVFGPDSGTHTDPVSGDTVTNEGQYTWVDAEPGWQLMAALEEAPTVAPAQDYFDIADAVQPAWNVNAVIGQFTTERDFYNRPWTVFNGSIYGKSPRIFSSATYQLGPIIPNPDSTRVPDYGVLERPVYPIYDATAYATWKQPNVVRFTDINPTTQLTADIWISVEDLAAAGIVAGPDTYFSAELSVVKDTAVNVNLATILQRIYIQYFDSTFATGPGTNASTAVLIDRAVAGASWLGSGDTDWNHTTVTIDDDYREGYAWSGIQLPATYDSGKPFKGIQLHIAVNVNSNNVLAVLDVVRGVVINGVSIDPTAIYINVPSDVHQSLEYGNYETSLRYANRILFFGDSITGDNYSLRDKAYISKLSEWLPYNCEGYGASGGTMVDGLNRLINGYGFDQNTFYLPIASRYQPANIYSNFVFIFYGENDRALFTKPDLRANLIRLLQGVKALGWMPILCPAYRAWEDAPVYAELASSAGILHLNTQRWARQFIRFVVGAYSGGTDRTPLPNQGETYQLFSISHPGTRSMSALANPMLNALKALPRPQESVKVFRLRESVSPSGIGELMAEDDYSRNAMWREISVAHYKITDATEANYDKMVSPGFNIDTQPSEYLQLQNSDLVDFGEYTLVEAILPTTGALVDSMSLNWPIFERGATGSDPAPPNPTIPQNLQVYIRNLSQFPIPQAANLQTRFGFVGSAPTAGATYTASGPSGTFTFVEYDADRGELVFSPAISNILSKLTGAYPYGAGTLTKTAGTGPATISYTFAAIAQDADWYDQYDLPLGAWTECEADGDGNYIVPDQFVRYCLEYDKVTFLVVAPSGDTEWTSFGPPTVNWRGYKGKVPEAIPSSFTANRVTTYTEELAQVPIVVSGSLGSWTGTGAAATPVAPAVGYSPRTTALPSTTQQVVVISDTDTVTQAFDYTPDALDDYHVQIVVGAGYWPALFNGTGYPGLSPFTPDTFDYRQLKITITVGNFVYEFSGDETKVWSWWGEVVIDTVLPNITDVDAAPIDASITVSCVDGSAELAYVSVRHYTPATAG